MAHGLWYFFFFQAEDGIRDGRVTGVQTCALPICPCPTGGHPGQQPVGQGRGRLPDEARVQRRPAAPAPRSEERRVGEKWRSWGGPCYLKKKKNKSNE